MKSGLEELHSKKEVAFGQTKAGEKVKRFLSFKENEKVINRGPSRRGYPA